MVKYPNACVFVRLRYSMFAFPNMIVGVSAGGWEFDRQDLKRNCNDIFVTHAHNAIHKHKYFLIAIVFTFRKTKQHSCPTFRSAPPRVIVVNAYHHIHCMYVRIARTSNLLRCVKVPVWPQLLSHREMWAHSHQHLTQLDDAVTERMQYE